MSVAMLLSVRPQWPVTPLGGPDRIYRLHRWSGIPARTFGIAYGLIELSGSLLKSAIGSAGRLPKVRYEGGAR